MKQTNKDDLQKFIKCYDKYKICGRHNTGKNKKDKNGQIQYEYCNKNNTCTWTSDPPNPFDQTQTLVKTTSKTTPVSINYIPTTTSPYLQSSTTQTTIIPINTTPKNTNNYLWIIIVCIILLILLIFGYYIYIKYKNSNNNYKYNTNYTNEL